MIAEIISVGADAGFGAAGQPETQVLAREMALLGLELRYQTPAGDQKTQLQQVMAQALRRSDVILTFGGVGMGPADWTKEVICGGLSIPMDLNNESYHQIRAYYENAGLPVPPEAQRAALLPRGGAVFFSDTGVVPGCAVSAGDQCVIMLPGAPDEATSMFMNSVYPYLSTFAGAIVASRVARIFGMDVENATQKLSDLTAGRNPTLALYTQKSEVLARVTARAGNKAQASNMCTPVLKEVVNRLGDFVYGIDVDSLQAVVVTHLTQKSLRMGCAEAGTSGLFAQKLNAVPGAANVFKFSVAAHANRVKTQVLGVPEKMIKKYGAVCERVAVQMACGAMDAGEADVGVGITGAIGSPSEEGKPAGTVYIAVCDKNNVILKSLVMPPESEPAVVREYAVMHALNLVRLMLDYDPEPFPGAIPLSAALKGKFELEPSGDSDAFPGEDVPKKKARRAKESDTRGSRRGVRIAMLVVVCLALLGGGGFFGLRFWQSWQNKSLYEAVAVMAQAQPEGEPPSGYPEDFDPALAALWEENENFRGVLRLADVSYPVVQAKNNEYYKNHDFRRKSSKFGAPFVDSKVDLQRPSENVIVYGQNVSGQMFASLLAYKDAAYVKEHPLLYVDTVYGKNVYQVAGVVLANTDKAKGPVFAYTSFIDAEDGQVTVAFGEQIAQRTLVSTGVQIGAEDQLLCLSTTDSGGDTLLVVGRRLQEDEDPDTTGIEKNADPQTDADWSVADVEITSSDEDEDDLWADEESTDADPDAPEEAPVEAPVSGEESSAPLSSTAPAPSAPPAPVPSSSIAPSSSAAPSTPPPAPVPSSSAAPSSSVPASSAPPVLPSSSSSKPASSTPPPVIVSSSTPSSTPPPQTSSNRPGAIKPGESINIFGSGGKPANTSSSAKEESASPDDAWWSDNFEGTDSEGSRSEEDDWWKGNAGTENTSNGSAYKDGETITVLVGGKEVTAPFQEIVERVVQVEMGKSFHEEALKAQAVAAYTYIQYSAVRGQKASVMLADKSAVTSKVASAVNSVFGEEVLYNDKPINATYFASSAGVTNNSEDVWGSSLKYLRSVDSEEDVRKKEVRLDLSYVRKRIEKEAGVDTEDFEPEQWFEEASYCENGEYVESIKLCGKKKKDGTWIRSTLLEGKLPSHAFDVEYDDSDEVFIFTAYGNGHGVGMSQLGAQAMAEDGSSYTAILKHYYTGVRVG